MTHEIIRAARLLTKQFDKHMRKAGIKPNQFSILMSAYHNKGILLTRMAEHLGMERTTLTRNASVLAGLGMLTIKEGEDKRERRISITAKGVAFLEHALPFWQEAQAEFVEKLGHEKWVGLLAGLHGVAKNF